MDYAKLNMDALWQLISAGDEDALQEIVTRFTPLIVSESKVYGRVDEDIAQDIREVFVKAIKKEARSQGNVNGKLGGNVSGNLNGNLNGNLPKVE